MSGLEYGDHQPQAVLLGWGGGSVSVSLQHRGPCVWPDWPVRECVTGLLSSSCQVLLFLSGRCSAQHLGMTSSFTTCCTSQGIEIP